MDNQTTKISIFFEELLNLKSEGLISDEDYESIKLSYIVYNKKRYPEKKTYPDNKGYSEQKSYPERVTPTQPNPVPKKVISPQEVRDRNISLILIIGVIMVLLSGLILGTSNWDLMNAVSKTAMIGLVAILFLGISVFSDRWLKITKTSYAFWILGSLFIPVAIISAGFFELFGSWFSIQGSGRYLFGMAGTAICLPFFVFSSFKYNSRLFTWLSLATLSVGAIFLIASFNPSVDIFFLFIIIYNSLLIATYFKLKNSSRLKLFIQESLLFIQFNLIISTLFTLGFFNNHWLYGINVILTAGLYGYLVFSKGSKEYSFVISALIIYGIYQIVTYTPAAALDFVLFSLVGFIFIGIAFVFKNDNKLKKIFQYTSGFVSMLAFLFIIIKGLQGTPGRSALMISISFLIIALNYSYLAYRTKEFIFSNLAPFFLVLSWYQLYDSLERLFGVYPNSIHMFIIASIMFILLYRFNNNELLKPIKNSCLIVSILTMCFSIISAIHNNYFIISGILLHALGIALYVAYRYVSNKVMKEITKWVIPIIWFVGLLMFFDKLKIFIYPDYIQYAFAVHFATSAFILFAWSMFWGRFDLELKRSFFCISHIVIIWGVLYTQVVFEFFVYQIPIVFIVTTVIYIYSMGKSKSEYMINLFLYGAFGISSLILNAIFKVLEVHVEWHSNTMFISSILIFVLYLVAKEFWKKRIAYYLIPFTSLAVLIRIFSPSYIYRDFWLVLIFIIMVIFINHNNKINILNVIPLGLLTLNILALDYNNIGISTDGMLIFILSSFFILNIIGTILSKYLYANNRYNSGHPSLDLYSIFALLNLLLSFKYSEPHTILIINLLPYILLSCWLAYQTRRVEGSYIKKVFITLATVSILLPYYKLLGNINVPNLIVTEIRVLPWVILAALLTRLTWKNYHNAPRRIEMLVLLVVAAVLLRDILQLNNIYDGLILGVITLFSIIAGLHIKAKSYFFIGTGCFVLNVLILTKSLWQSLPWWSYLLGAGMLLIITASISEMHKNKKDKKTFKQSKDAIVDRFNSWH